MCSLKEAVCITENSEEGPPTCPTTSQSEVIERVKEIYQDKELAKLALEAARVEASGYMRWTRVEEIIQLAKRMGYKKLGIGTCLGLINESRTLTQILEAKGFQVVSICCKTGGIPKEFIGIKDDEKVYPGRHESMCNPIAQAEILNEERCDFNILMGLCVGHDALFLKHVKALTTVLVVKDRVLCHNPVAAIYNTNMYYHRLLAKET
jgi:uncharacterized metal-binding protein